jgi:glycosyltransferase involved in cell wall biosynthesis
MFGGIERLLVTLAKCRQFVPDMDPEYAICFEGRLSEALHQEQVPVHLLGAVRASKPWTILSARRNLLRLLKDRHYDIAVCHAAWPHAMFAATLRKFGIPFVTFAHDTWHGKHWIERWAKRTPPDAVISNSLYTEGFVKNLFPNVKCVTIYLPCLMPDLSLSKKNRIRTRESHRISDTQSVIIYAGRMEEWKGPLVLMDALAILRDDSSWFALIAGGPQTSSEDKVFQELKKRVERSNLNERIRILGFRQDVPDLLCASDIHCQPNTSGEPFGLSFIEALSAGLPLVTSNVGAAPEIVTPECGIITNPNQPHETAHALRKLFDNNQRNRLSNCAANRAKELCDPAKQTLRISEVLESTIASSPSRDRAE